MTARRRWTHRPSGSNWGDFGPDDQLGRLNLINKRKVLDGMAQVREGITFCLSLPLDYPGGSVLSKVRKAPALRPTVRDGAPHFLRPLGEDGSGVTEVVCDDAVDLYLQYSTQWDSLAHVGHLFDADGDGEPEMVFYNGYRGGVDIISPPNVAVMEEARWAEPPRSSSAAHALGIENIAAHGMQGRGVMIDLAAHVGLRRAPVGYDALMRIIEADRIEIEPGDMVCLRTGFADAVLAMKRQPDERALSELGAGLDGRDEKLLGWIADSGLAALIADNFAVEYYPVEGRSGCAMLGVHQLCLFKLGIPLGELWHLSPLADWLRERARSAFLLTAPPLRLPGAVGSPVTPIATV